MTTLTLQNFRSIANRSFATKDRVTLFAGPNGSGKTNAILALRALLTGEGLPPGLLKKDADVMVTDGAKEALATLANETWTVTGHWPKGVIETTGTPPRISHVAAGMVNVAALDDDDRAALIGGVIGSTPSVERLAAELQLVGVPAAQCAGIAEGILKDWATSYTRAQTKGTELKGEFKSATGETWGINKGSDWCPKGWTADLATLTVEALTAETDKLAAAVNEMKAGAAVATHTKEQADQAARERIGLQAELNRLTSDLDRLTTKRNEVALPVPAPQKCPCCGESLAVMADGKIAKPVNVVAESENTRRRTERERLAGEIQRIEDERTAARANIDACLRIERANTTPGKCTQDDVTAAQSRYTDALARLGMVKARENARAIHSKLVLNAAVQKLLAPDGLKRTVLLEKLAPLNEALAAFSAAAGWTWGVYPAVVSIDTDLNVRYAGRDYRWGISEAQQYRAATTVQCVLAAHAKESTVLIDRADILDSAGRNGLMGALLQSGIPHAFIGMTISKAGEVPDLAKAGIGASYWMGV